MKKLITLLLAILLTSCSGANISSHVRESGEEGSSKMIRCLSLTTGKADVVNDELKKYDGWKMVYASEYTTENKTTSEAVMCFEKPYTK